MSQNPISIPQNPALDAALDFYYLRREGIGLIEEMAGRLWTDYNIHDPGVTILEALCYAITDVAYRTGWDMKDLLAPETPAAGMSEPYPGQAFFSARNIMTTNPATPDDFRRLLIDLAGIRNAWLSPGCSRDADGAAMDGNSAECACGGACDAETGYYAWGDDQLRLSWSPPEVKTEGCKRVVPQGASDALLQLEFAPEIGDLNDRKVDYRQVSHDADGNHVNILELRFPDISILQHDVWDLFVGDESNDAFSQANGASFTAKVLRLGATKTYDVFTDQALGASERTAYMRSHWRGVLYVNLEIELLPNGKKILFENVALRMHISAAQGFGGWVDTLNALPGADGFKLWFEAKPAIFFVQSYRRKARAAQAAIASARAALLEHRNLDEDIGGIRVVHMDDVAVCADVEVRADADIELIQGRIWFEIDRYFNPPVPSRTLRELVDAGEDADSMFNGPALDAGFIRDEDLQNASFRSVLRVSDLINILMDIEGVVAVNRVRITKYDEEGNVAAGAADPDFDRVPLTFEEGKTAASWLMYIGAGHQPRLYLNGSRFLFYKNGLPFLPRMDEATDIMHQLRGEFECPKNYRGANDLPVPRGEHRRKDDYAPVQYSLPETYGVRPEGLPPTASPLRQAQAMQLKGYLMVFEQMLGNALAQLEHTADLFSLDPGVRRTYFVKALNEALIARFGVVTKNLDTPAVEAIAENRTEFLDRRNRFLDHLLARFGEQFDEYAMLLSNADGREVAQARLIESKIAFLKAYPRISSGRARAFDYSRPAPFDYTRAAAHAGNQPGIKKRINLLLGHPDLEFSWRVQSAVGGKFQLGFQLADRNGRPWLEGSLDVEAGSEPQAKLKGLREILQRMVGGDAYRTPEPEASGAGSAPGYRLRLDDGSINLSAYSAEKFGTREEALAMRDVLQDWSANERLIVVEHFLLRPKFLGDALYPACGNGGRATCGDEDPYSFRLTFVMPGWTERYTDNLEMRRFAERTIQEQTPAHLLGKACWVGNDEFIEDPCAEIVAKLAQLVLDRSGAGQDGACQAAAAIHHAFCAAFKKWYEGKELDYMHEDALREAIAACFSQDIPASTVEGCEPFWDDVQKLMTAHFAHQALTGWQFERFEAAWFRWLDANAGMAWDEQRLHERVQAILRANIVTEGVRNADISRYAAQVLAEYGAAFYRWMEANVRAGQPFERFSATFTPPPIALPAALEFRQPQTDRALAELLNQRYPSYADVSYRLWIVLDLLGRLHNTYPGAFLHSCGEIGTRNPVRLNSTLLGNYPLRTSIN